MKAFVAFCGTLITSPSEAIAQMLEQPRTGTLLTIFFWGVLAQVCASAIAAGGFTLGSSYAILAGLLSTAVTLLFATAMFHLFAGLLGGEGQALNLLRACLLLYFPNTLLPAFALAGPTALQLASVAVACWQLLLLLTVLRQVYRLPADKAVLTVVLPLVLVVAIPMGFLLVLGIGLSQL